MTYRMLAPGQRSRVLIGAPNAAEPAVLFETDELLLEAPNWSLDGSALYLNGNGLLWRLEVAHPERGIAVVHFDGEPELNNDHVLDPDGERVFLSAMDGHIYHAALSGGPVRRVTPDDGLWHFLHGVSPDGRRLAYVEIREFGLPSRLMLIPAAGGEPEHLAQTGPKYIDGPEWMPDGASILFNTENFTVAPGHAQLARMPDGGGEPERLVVSDTVDWFPHPSPDAVWGSYIAFPTGTLGHPADLPVVVHVVATADWSTSVQRYPVFGGQGTINVNSWAPDSSRFAFVAYPVD